MNKCIVLICNLYVGQKKYVIYILLSKNIFHDMLSYKKCKLYNGVSLNIIYAYV